MKHPNTMTEAERTERRDSFAGYSEGGQVERHAVPGGCYYLSERAGRYCLIAYKGKSLKPELYYSYPTAEKRAIRLASWVDGLRVESEARDKLRADRRNDTHSLRVGSVLFNSWGYEQTNIDWYQVVEVVSAKTVVIRKIARHLIPGEGISDMSGYSTPHVNNFTGEPMRVRANSHGVSMRHGHGSPWDGQPRYCSWYA